MKKLELQIVAFSIDLNEGGTKKLHSPEFIRFGRTIHHKIILFRSRIYKMEYIAKSSKGSKPLEFT